MAASSQEGMRARKYQGVIGYAIAGNYFATFTLFRFEDGGASWESICRVDPSLGSAG